VIEDDSGTPEKGGAGFRKLATQDGVVAVLGQFHSSSRWRCRISPSNSSAALRDPGLSRAFTEKHLNYKLPHHVIDTDRVQLGTGGSRRGFQEGRVLAENTDYGVGLVEDTKKLFGSMGVSAELKTIVFDRAVVDLTPQLLEIKSWKPDVVINIAWVPPPT